MSEQSAAESQVLSVFQEYWDTNVVKDERIFSLFPSDVTAFGTAAHEVVPDKEAMIRFMQIAFEQLPSMPKPEFLWKRVKLLGLSAAIVEAEFNYKLPFGKDGFNVRTRITFIFEQREDRWMIVHQHFSIPWALQEEDDDAWLETRNRELERKVTERTEALRNTQQQLIHQEKMASLGQLTAGIAHEIKNPLNFVNNFAVLNEELIQELKDKLDPEEDVSEIIDMLRLNTRQIGKHGKRANEIVQSMMHHAKGSGGGKYEVALNPLVEEFVNLTYSSIQAQNLELEVTIEKGFDEAIGSLRIAPQEIGRVLQNLSTNAFEAVLIKKRSSGAEYQPTIVVTTQHENSQVQIRVSDNGPGISEDVLDKIFAPFFTTKPTGSGTGLGLSLSYDIVTQGHGGSLEVEHTSSEGTTFLMTLPSNNN